ncbi:hypothetical protein D9M68_861140 [compost metagenome]
MLLKHSLIFDLETRPDVAAHEPSHSTVTLIGLGIDQYRSASAHRIQSCLAEAIGSSAEFSIARGSNITEKIDEISPLGTNWNPVGACRTTQPSCSIIADLENSGSISFQKRLQRDT